MSDERFGPWRLLSELGRGGMGVVHRAIHADTGQVAALKTVRSADPVERAALRREIRALARVDHPGVARILDEGVAGDRAWYAMTLYEADTLREAWRGGAVPAETTVVGEDLARGAVVSGAVPIRADWRDWLPTLGALAVSLAHVHGAGLVHGDLKPGNVLVPSRARPVLVDFGLTSRLGAREDAERLSSVSAIAGTPAYMAPERCAGRTFDSRADLYALGCMLYELFCGEPPFVGDTDAVLAAHREAPPVPLRDRVHDLPAGMDDLVAGLLAKDPRDRPAHAAAVAEALGTPTPDAPWVLLRPHLAGRDAPFRRLAGALDRAIAGTGSAMLLRGEAGVGKTRVAMELTALARQRGVAVISGQCIPLDRPADEPLSSFANAVRHAVWLARRDGPDRTRELFGERARLVRQWVSGVSAVPGFEAQPEAPDLPPDAGRQVLADTLVDLVLALAATPTVLLVDDAHWADDLTAELLGRLAEAAPRHALLLLVTARPGDPAAAVRDALGRLEAVELGPLGPEDGATLVADMLGGPAPQGILAETTRVADGSPFLLGEAVRAAVARGALRWTGTRWAEGNPVVLDREALVALRLDTLTGTQREVLVGAWVLGRRALPERLAALTALPEEVVLDESHRLAQAELIVPEPTGGADFAHALIRDVVVGRLDEAARRRLHLEAARLLEDAPEVGPHEVADHLWAGGDPDAARPLYQRAAREALDRFALQDAERWLRRAAESATPDALAVEAVLELATRVLVHGGRAREAADALEAALPQVDTLRDPALAARVRSALVASLRILGRYERATEVALEARALAHGVGAATEEARAMAELARVRTLTGDLDEAAALCREGLALEPEWAAERLLLKYETLALWYLSRPMEAARRARALLALTEAAEGRYGVTEARYVLALVQVEAGEQEESIEGMRACGRDFEAMGAHRMAALCRGNVAAAAFRDGRHEEAIAQLRASARALRAAQDPRTAALTELNLGTVQEALGDHEAALETYRAAARVLEGLGEAQVPRALAGVARNLRRTGGDDAEAVAALDRARAVASAPELRLFVLAEDIVRAAKAGHPTAETLADLEALAAEVGEAPYLADVLAEARATAASGSELDG